MIKSPHRFGRGKECGERRVENVKSEKRGVLICRLSICQSFLDQKRRSCKMGRLADRGGGRSKVVGFSFTRATSSKYGKKVKKKREKNTSSNVFFGNRSEGLIECWS